MLKHWCYFFFLTWVSYLIVSTILLFTHGFLLTRDAQENVTTCVSFDEVPCSEGNFACSREEKLSFVLADVNAASNVCLPQRAKVLLLVVDALRYDFALTDGSLENPLPYQNKLPVIQKLLQSEPEYSRLYQFVADPPTTTMQRLKGLTTGSLPTFIDAGSNFASTEIKEDNIIDQVCKPLLIQYSSVIPHFIFQLYFSHQ